jgi:predicted metal-dependent phosphoesterase TrpH
MLIDLHNHTWPASDDSLLSPEELIEKAKASGMDGICITDHDWFWDPEEVKHLGEKMDFLVIPGVEINTEEGHLLVFGLEEYVFGMHRASFVKNELEKNGGGAIIAAHPYRRQYKPEHDAEQYQESLEKAARKGIYAVADGIEVMNGRGKDLENNYSGELAGMLGMSGAATSDAHQQHDIAKNATRFERRITGLEDLITELKAGRFKPEPLR